jgi:zinc transport system substrate-binding protein
VSFRLLCLCTLLLAIAGALGAEPVRYVATIHPVRMILEPVVEGRATVDVLLPPTASAHTWEPKPSDARRVADARALFTVDPSYDGWAGGLGHRNTVALFPMVPEPQRHGFGCAGHGHGHDHGHDHDHAEGSPDPHFWPDPTAVRSMLPALVERLSALDPEGAATYRANAQALDKELVALDAELASTLAPVRGRGVVLFHPSILYLLNRYDLRLAGVVEELPGKEPSPRHLSELAKKLRKAEARAVLAEPQLNPRSAEVVAEAAGVKLGLLDPIGGVPGRMTYAELLRDNAKTLRTALE